MKTATQREPKLTFKQKKFVRGIVEGKPNYKAAMDAYDTDKMNVANSIAGENLQKPAVREAIEREFEKQGITLSAIIKPIADGLKAQKDDGNDDHAIRLKASGMAAQFLGIGKDGSQGNTFVFNFNKNDDNNTPRSFLDAED